MLRLSRLVSLAAASALLLTAASLAACKHTNSAARATAGDGAVTAKPNPPSGSRSGWTRSCSPNASETGTCADAHGPVCGMKADLTSTTFADRCAACRDPKILYYTPGACTDASPA